MNEGSLKLRVQDYLSLGYLFILVVGLLRDAIFYSFLGINILEYASITDVLISPLAYIIEQPLILGLLAFFLLIIAYQKKLHHALSHIAWYRNLSGFEKMEEKMSKPNDMKGTMLVVALVIGSMLLGAGIGAGQRMNKLITTGELEMRDEVELLSGDIIPCRIIGQNSSYIFLVEKGNTQVDILPIPHVVQRISSLKE